MLTIKNLYEIINIAECRNIEKLFGGVVTSISYDSRTVEDGAVFFAYKGANYDSTDDAIKLFRERKVSLIVTDRMLDDDIAFIKTDDVRKALAESSNAFFGYPMKGFMSVAITGTNGKTTTTFLIESIFNNAGVKVVKIGTNGVFIDGEFHNIDNTTPSSYDILKYMKLGADIGCKGFVMEVSSHALDQNRVYGMTFDVAIFTNLTGDHLDYHKDMEHYFKAKAKLFIGDMAKDNIINIETDYGRRLIEINNKSFKTYAVMKDADIYPKKYTIDRDGIEAELSVFGKPMMIKSSLIGKHNLENILAGIGATKVLNIDDDAIVKGIENLKSVEGRLERVAGKGVTAFIDYAHTDDALKNVLESLKRVPHNRLITVFGAGGNRDKSKRPRMMKVAEEMSDIVIVTSDNPRKEKPEDIIKDILAGSIEREKIIVIADRELAILKAVEVAKSNDIILIAGKGHEKYQIVGNVKTHFDDVEITKRALKIS